jgi:hypothetical protein
VAVAAANAYLRLREASHVAALNEVEMARVADDALVAERGAVKALWEAVFGREAAPVAGTASTFRLPNR